MYITTDVNISKVYSVTYLLLQFCFCLLFNKIAFLQCLKVKVKSSTCYSASYMRRTQDQKLFTILEVAADWHELMIPQRTMRPSTGRVIEQLDLWFAASRHTIAPISHIRPSPHSCELLLNSRPTNGKRLSWPKHTVG